MWADGHLQTRLENESLAKMIRCLAINMYPSIQVISGLWISDMSASETRQETLMTRLFSCSIRLALCCSLSHIPSFNFWSWVYCCSFLSRKSGDFQLRKHEKSSRWDKKACLLFICSGKLLLNSATWCPKCLQNWK